MNRGPIVEALIKSKHTEEALNATVTANRKKLWDVIVELKKGLAENADKAAMDACLKTGVLVLEGLDWTPVPDAVSGTTLTTLSPSKTESKPFRLDSNTPVFSNKPGEPVSYTHLTLPTILRV